MINAPTTNREDILKSLKTGRAYGVDFYPKMDVPFRERVERIQKVPVVKKVDLAGDTLRVAVDQPAQEIHFIGQDGIIRHTVFDTSTAEYRIREEDTYLRTVFRFKDGSSIYLNPIVRYNGDKPVSLMTATIDQSKTLYLRIAYFLIALTGVYFFRRRKQKRASE